MSVGGDEMFLYILYVLYVNEDYRKLITTNQHKINKLCCSVIKIFYAIIIIITDSKIENNMSQSSGTSGAFRDLEPSSFFSIITKYL